MREINYRTNCRVNISTAANRKLSKILKMGAVVVNQTVALPMNCVNSRASNPPFLKLRQALMRSLHATFDRHPIKKNKQ